MNDVNRRCDGRKRTKDGLCLVSNASKLGVGSLGDDYKSLRQADEFVEVAHIGCPVLESGKGTESHIGR